MNHFEIDDLVGKEVTVTYANGETITGTLRFNGREEVLLLSGNNEVVIFKSQLKKMEAKRNEK